MSLLVLGLSHHTAPLSVIEELTEAGGSADAIAEAVLASAVASEVVVLTTCNRLEVYAEVSAFHSGVAAIGEALADAAGQAPQDLTEHLYVRYDDSAVAHAFTVACGLDSMAVGESQILAQMREALAVGQAEGRVGQSLNSLFQQALRVGKRAHSETDIDSHSVSLVQAGLERAAELLGPAQGLRVSVVGAGGMSGLAAANASRTGVAALTIVNRTPERAERLAAATAGVARPWSELADVLADSDVVIACTGALGHVISGADLAASAVARAGRPQVVVDLALPRDVQPEAEWGTAVPSAHILDLEALGRLLEGRADAQQVSKVHELVTGEVAAYLTRRMENAVAPTVAALRSRAAQVVAAEMDRLDQRLPALDEETRAEVSLAVHRIVEKLLHTPTRRVKEYAMEGAGPDYAAALRELFDLEPKDVANVATPPRMVGS
ncbi:MAG TPA: glutamyl-tRNA reductase [Intrasporangium sp.]|uniref:glutamyl-tRNA reductase n=1 Tax=Intrasporangium sp. TaxID=1925024 RepID=UPI002D770C21|nr:glutamyl-tRNA reductase [Intrasporangium sp.]HET7397260.1 glutamyl-tRNA reductase [Intrasporangium sp.]